MNLFFARIHWGNYVYAYLRSWFEAVHFVEATVPRAWLKRFHRVRFEDIFSYDEWVRLRDEVWAEWAKVIPSVRPDAWRTGLFRLTVNFYRIALQHLCKDYLLHRRLVRYIQHLEVEQACIADSVTLRYLLKKAEVGSLGINDKLQIRSGAWFWDLLYCWQRNLVWSTYLVVQAGLVVWSKTDRSTIEILHEGLSYSESGMGLRELSFSWIKDRGVCQPGQILFVLASHPKRWAADILRRETLLRGLGWRTALYAVSYGLLVLAAGLVHASRPEAVFLTEFKLRCIVPYLVAERRKIRTYLTTVSALDPQHPWIALFNAMGIRTVLWAYGSNISLFNQHYLSAERHFHLAHLETGESWVWSKHHLTISRQGEIYAPTAGFRVIGPAMMGDASPCLIDPSESRRRFMGIDAERETAWRYLAIFDMNPVSKEGQLALQLGPLVVTEELVEAFYKDLIRLLEDFPDIRLLVKTKRRDHPYRTKPPSLKRLVDQRSDWVRVGRVIELDPEINPYIPIGTADLAVGLPFSSPVIAALHFGRRGIYHDPLGVALQHHYHDLDDMISHGYEDLEKKVRFWLYECSEESFQAFLNRPETQQFLGPRPGADPAEEFGKALWGDTFRLPTAGSHFAEEPVLENAHARSGR